jgi:hypothetical protein
VKLEDVKDIDLLRAGLVSIDELEHDGAVIAAFECGLIAPVHDWSKTLGDLADEPPYQFCRDCGTVRRSPWPMDPNQRKLSGR